MTKLQLFEEAVIGLIKEKPFFGYLLMTVRRTFTNEIPTAGIAIKANGIHLYVNLDFLAGMSLRGRMSVLEHEMLHILHAHPARHKQLNKEEVGTDTSKVKTPKGESVVFDDKIIFNIAADCAINQYLKNFNEVTIDGKSVGVTLKTLQERVKEPLLSNQHSEYYYSKIKDDLKDKVQSGELAPHGDHDKWEESDLSEEQAMAKIQKHLKTAKDLSDGQGLTTEQNEMLSSFLQSKIDWKSQFRSFIANAEEFLVEDTRKKRNRRYGIVYAGKKVEPKFKIGVCVDTSGSVSDEELSQFFAEIKAINNLYNVEIWVIEADSEVKDFYKFDKRHDGSFKGRGGTAYNPAIKKALDLGVDCIAYLGDGDAADRPIKPNIPFLWVMVRDNNPPADWGRVIHIK